jgi:hypothetical protein
MEICDCPKEQVDLPKAMEQMSPWEREGEDAKGLCCTRKA